MTIAVDFDGTIVEHRYPEIGAEIPFATQALKQLYKDGHNLILWTYRAGKELDDAVKFCEEKGLRFYAINKNYPEEVYDRSISRKIIADMYIDDRNYGGMPSWGEIYASISGQPQELVPVRKGFWRSLFSK